MLASILSPLLCIWRRGSLVAILTFQRRWQHSARWITRENRSHRRGRLQKHINLCASLAHSWEIRGHGKLSGHLLCGEPVSDACRPPPTWDSHGFCLNRVFQASLLWLSIPREKRDCLTRFPRPSYPTLFLDSVISYLIIYLLFKSKIA